MSRARSVIVTGGSRGVGAALVRAFLERGDRVATCSRSSTDEVERFSADPSVAGRYLHEAVDISDRDEVAEFVARVVDRFDTIDVLVNNAGVAIDGVLPLVPDDDIDAVIKVNLRGTIQITKAVSRRMLAHGGGRIINISSIAGLTGYRGLAVYGATKAALDGFTRALARELGSRSITVNSVAPGYLRTDMTHGLDDEHLAQITRRTPAGRLAEPEDVAAAVLFLASPEAAFITGHVLVVDGGLTA